MELKRHHHIFYSPIFFGVIAGSLAVLAQPLFKIHPPQAYGICTICHARDFLNWFSERLFSFNFESAEVSIHYPLATTIGIILGSISSSKLNGEFKFIKVENLIIKFFLGIVVSHFGLLIMSCPTRLFLRFAFGDPFSLFAIAGLLSGITFGVIILKRV
jgi:multidrug transporter EmrE-like cation transporter